MKWFPPIEVQSPSPVITMTMQIGIVLLMPSHRPMRVHGVFEFRKNPYSPVNGKSIRSGNQNNLCLVDSRALNGTDDGTYNIPFPQPDSKYGEFFSAKVLVKNMCFAHSKRPPLSRSGSCPHR
jgi:hypothetical protein